jgi:O-antigen/teichoic acid export membrane protein
LSQSAKLLTGSTWALYKIIAVQFINFGAIAILSRQLEPADFGLVALANVAQRFFNVISAQGINEFIIYDNSANLKEKLNAAFWLNLIFSFCSTLIGIAAIPWIANFYEEPLLASILLVLFLRFPIDVISKLPDAILHKSLEFKSIEIRDTILQLTAAILSVSMALTGYGVWSLVLPSLIAAPIRLIIAFRVVKWRPSLNLYTKHWKEILKYSSTIIGSTLTNFVISQGDTLLVGRLLGSVQLGLYNLSWTASNLISKTLVTLTNKMALPAFAAQKGNVDAIFKALTKVLFAIASISFPVLIWMFVIADYVVLTLYGDKWVDSILPFQILLIYAIRYSVGAPIGSVFKAMGRPDLNFKLGLFIIPFYILSIWIGSNYGIVGVATGVTFVRTLFGLLSFWLGARILKKPLVLMMKPLRMPFLISVLSCLLTFVVDRYMIRTNFDVNPLIGLIYSFMLMGISYLLLAKFLFKEVGSWLGGMLQSLSKGKVKAAWFK